MKRVTFLFVSLLFMLSGFCYEPPKLKSDPPTLYSGIKLQPTLFRCVCSWNPSTGRSNYNQTMFKENKYFTIKNNVAYFCDKDGKRVGSKYYYRKKVHDKYMFCSWSLTTWFEDNYILYDVQKKRIEQLFCDQFYSWTTKNIKRNQYSKSNNSNSGGRFRYIEKPKHNNSSSRGRFRYIENPNQNYSDRNYGGTVGSSTSPYTSVKSLCPRCHGSGTFEKLPAITGGIVAYHKCFNCGASYQIGSVHSCRCNLCGGTGYY